MTESFLCPASSIRIFRQATVLSQPSFHPPLTLYNKDTPMTGALPPEIVMNDAEIDEAVAFINGKRRLMSIFLDLF